MQIPRLPRAETFLFSLLLATPAAAMLHCDNVRVDGYSFDLTKLGGPHSVVTTLREPPSYSNTTYTVDICKPLKKSGDAPKEEQCPNGTRVCAIQRTYNDSNPDKSNAVVHKVVPIAGSLQDHGAFNFEFEATRLKTSDSNSDVQKEGVRLILKGGAYPLDVPHKEQTRQRAIVEFICDPEKEGTENEWDPTDDKYDPDGSDEEEGDDNDGGKKEKARRADGEKQLIKDGAALKFISYGKETNSDWETLRLEWSTKYACESAYGEGSASWGFFTWLVIIVFLGIAAYLIFGSWLNYNRYGARGWDLVPHGDAIRDIPYLMKDWTRSVLNTVQGSGSRGGYSAV
ncbi:hypothetical protein jhhlp_006848 [Lomentospora prolificans]|uniref:Autophagy-related protein 27 n=1 Tax=Lomentospora prolificans TaxID=41688 RepID=A0A2N3N2Y1_9PEZI|nr:hypothetical protein jhhlp_006848 [Lomentospora prolificans]